MTKDTPDVGDAYALKTPEDSRKLYAGWAESYDNSFAANEDYQLHAHTARAFAAMGGRGPLLDVGAGTGLCGQVLADLDIGPIDATDISAEMLAQAMRKDVYRDAILANIVEGLPVRPGSYRGVVSSGTFTTGHVGPDAIDALLKVARSGAQFALSINAQHYESAGFAAKLDSLSGSISDLTLQEVRIYGQSATGPHKDDRALIALFKKA